MLTWLRKVWGALTLDPVHPRDPQIRRMLGINTYSSSGVAVDEYKALGISTVWRGVNILANGVARPRLYAYQRLSDDGRQRAVNHPAWPLVARKANPQMVASEFRRVLTHHALLWGNGTAYIVRDRGGRPLELLPLLPDRTRLVRVRGGAVETSPDGNGELLYVTRIGDEWRRLLPENVLHIRGLGYSGFWGYPVVELLANSLGAAIAARDFAGEFLGNGLIASGVITYEGALDEEQDERFKESVQDAHSGLGRRHRVMLLEEGMKFQQLTIPPEHAQLLQTREFQVRDVANVIGIQPHKLGDNSRTSYNSLEQANQEYLDDDLDPWLGRWEDECSDKLLSEREKQDETYYLEFNRASLYRMDLQSRTAFYQAGRQWGWLSRNDVRRKENMEPVEGGDTYLEPLNMQPVNADPAEPAAAAAAEPLRITATALVRAELERVARQVGRQAKNKSKQPREFCTWLEKLAVRGQSPAAVDEHTTRMLSEYRRELNAIVDQVTAEQLPGAVQQATAAMLGRVDQLCSEWERSQCTAS